MINKFNNVKNPNVSSTHSIDDVLYTIKNGDDNLDIINSIRTLGKTNILYDELKTTKLPTFRFNFTFENKANNNNITQSTGFIYIDVDNCNSLQSDNSYVFASWKSLSNAGYGILVKVEGLNQLNFKDTYMSIGKELNLNIDENAGKPSQQTVLTYDANLYHNPESLIFKAINKKVSNAIIKKKERGGITMDDTFSESSKIRFDNINDYFIDNDKPYIYFNDEKEYISQPFIPRRVEDGDRNTTLFYVLGQYSLLNPSLGENYLINWANTININVMYPRLDEQEIKGIVKSVLKKRFEKTLDLNLNKARRILFNPSNKMNQNEKMKITNKLNGKAKKEVTKKEIYDIIEGWNFDFFGKITQKKVVLISSKSIATIKRYWGDFEAYVRDLNNNKVSHLSTPKKMSDIYCIYKCSDINKFVIYEDLFPDSTRNLFTKNRKKIPLFEIRAA